MHALGLIFQYCIWYEHWAYHSFIKLPCDTWEIPIPSFQYCTLSIETYKNIFSRYISSWKDWWSCFLNCLDFFLIKAQSDSICRILNPALISIAKNISSTSSRSSLRLIWNCKQSFNYDSTHYEALSSLRLSGVDCHQRGFGEIFLSYWPRQEAKAWPGLPALASPTLDPIHQRSQWKTFPALEAQDGPLLRAPGCWGPQSGRNHNWNFKFRLQFQINRNELHDKVLEIFFAGDIKKTLKSLKLVSVHDRNKAWINKYRDSFLLQLLWTILIVLLYIFINLLRTETIGNLSDFR